MIAIELYKLIRQCLQGTLQLRPSPLGSGEASGLLVTLAAPSEAVLGQNRSWVRCHQHVVAVVQKQGPLAHQQRIASTTHVPLP